MGHSPELIAGRLAAPTWSRHDQPRVNVSIHLSSFRPEGLLAPPDAQRHKLRRGRRRCPGGSPASCIKQRRSITERSTEVEGRGTPGHWEVELHADRPIWPRVACSRTIDKPASCIGSTRPTIGRISSLRRTIARRLGKLPKTKRKTISFDIGTEFADYHRLHRCLGVQTAFYDPHSPCQKFGVENSIARLGCSLTGKTDLSFITAAALQAPRSAPQRYPSQMPGLLDTRLRHSPSSYQSLHFKRDSISPRSRGRRRVLGRGLTQAARRPVMKLFTSVR